MKNLLIAVLFIGSLLFSGYILTLSPGETVVLEDLSYPEAIFASEMPLEHNWEDINIMGGKVSKDFTLKNTQDIPLYLEGAVTSCMCTTAFFTLQDGTESGAFGMHGGPNWSAVIAPGESFDVKVVFDPLAHGPEATGPIQRTVNVIGRSTPDSEGISYTRIDVRGEVLSEADFQKDLS